ncbi:MAG: radical SAM family heme chaperone HemW [Saprospirales bacterium]|nr:radical SAM family heme chaperone HemW [Saprospirales bacterium]
MPGLYLHIPFCKQACHYCNFHFSTSLKYKEEMVQALVRELELQRDYLQGASLDTIYFGGGTPSLLSSDELQAIFDQIYRLFPVVAEPEVTLEANPDDLTQEKVDMLRKSPVNRLSIGIQSFAEEDLRFMNRAHSAGEALSCLQRVKDAGFENSTIDLIYGSPTTSDAQWAKNLDIFFQFDIPHLSPYCLTVEPQTALGHFVKKGKVPPVDEEKASRQFEYLMDTMAVHGYEHYEISNFAKPGRHSKHNSSYWLGEPYLGIGPAAHSFNGDTRQWNVANNAQYLKALAESQAPYELEILTPANRYNEYVMTSLRTQWGCDLTLIQSLPKDFSDHFLASIQPFMAEGQVVRQGSIFTLNRAGKLIADHIAAVCFV